MPSPRPALDELHERLVLNGVAGDARQIATALLGLARVNGWTERPERMVTWLEQLALDLARPPRKQGADE